jgi:hypothetical protein
MFRSNMLGHSRWEHLTARRVKMFGDKPLEDILEQLQIKPIAYMHIADKIKARSDLKKKQQEIAEQKTLRKRGLERQLSLEREQSLRKEKELEKKKTLTRFGTSSSTGFSIPSSVENSVRRSIGETSEDPAGEGSRRNLKSSASTPKSVTPKSTTPMSLTPQGSEHAGARQDSQTTLVPLTKKASRDDKRKERATFSGFSSNNISGAAAGGAGSGGGGTLQLVEDSVKGRRRSSSFDASSLAATLDGIASMTRYRSQRRTFEVENSRKYLHEAHAESVDEPAFLKPSMKKASQGGSASKHNSLHFGGSKTSLYG